MKKEEIKVERIEPEPKLNWTGENVVMHNCKGRECTVPISYVNNHYNSNEGYTKYSSPTIVIQVNRVLTEEENKMVSTTIKKLHDQLFK